MEISEELYSWLRESEQFALPELEEEEAPELPNEILESLLSGMGVSALIRHLHPSSLVKTPDILALKEGNSPSIKLHNWNIIMQALHSLGFQIESDTKSLLIAGDKDSLTYILQTLRTEKPVREVPPEGGVYIESMDVSKPLFEADGCLEFLLLSFCHHFNLSPKQAAGLMTQGNRYLAHIVVKGLKGDFEPVVNWLQDIYSNTERLSDLTHTEKDSLVFVMNAIKPGFISKNKETVEWAFRVCSKLFLEFSENGLIDEAWDWFISEEQSPLVLSIYAIQRFGSELHQHVFEMYLQIGRFKELFSEHIKNSIQDTKDYFLLLLSFLPYLSESESMFEEVASSGVVGDWLEMGIREADKISGCRSTSMVFLCELVQFFYERISETAHIINGVLSLLNRLCRDESAILRFEATCMMFHMMDFLIEKSSHFAGVTYRALAFLLVESFSNEQHREYLVANFLITFKKYPGLPIGVIAEPVLKRLQMAQAPLETFDVDFFYSMASHPSLSLPHAVKLADLCGKLYLTDLIFAKGVGVVFTSLAFKHIEHEEMQDYLFMFCRYSLNLVLNTELLNAQLKAKKRSAKEMLMMEELRHQKNLILELVTWVLQQWQGPLNEKIQEIITEHKNTYFESASQYSTAFEELLDTIGKPVLPSSIQKNELFVPLEEDVEEDLKPKKKVLFPWERIHGDIERAKQNFVDKHQKEREEAERKLREFEAQQKKVQKQLEIRKIEQGRAREEVRVSLYNEGIAEKYVSHEELELKELMPDEAKSVQLLLKKYARVFLVWFQSYSGTGFERKKNIASDFDWLASRKEMVNEAEYIKLLSDHGVIPKLLTKEELKLIMKTYCQKKLKQAEQHYVNAEAFKDLFCQIAWFVYAKPRMDYSHLPPVFPVQAMFGHMRNYLRSKRMSTELFDEPDPGVGDKDVVRKLNHSLKQNPEAQMPEGYRKVNYSELSLNYHLPASLKLPVSYVAAYEALDAIISAALGFHLLEPIVAIHTSVKAKGIRTKRDSTELPPVQPKNRSPAPSGKKMSPALKMLVLNSKNKKTAEECAGVLEEILHSVSLKLNRVINRSTRSEEIQKEKEKAERQKEIDKRRLAKRQQVLQDLIVKAKTEREEKLKKEAERRLEIQAKQEARKQILAERARKEKEMKKQVLENYHYKKLQQEEEKKHIEEMKENKAKQDKMREIEDFKKKSVDKLKRLLKEKEDKIKKEKRKTENLGKAEQKQKAIMKKMTTKVLETARFESERENKAKEEFNSVIRDPRTKDIFVNHQLQIEEVFDYYCKRRTGASEFKFDSLDFDTFNKFMLQFSLSPGLLTVDETKKVFNTLTKNKTHDSSGSLSINIAEFEESIVHIASKAKNKLHTLNHDPDERFSHNTLNYLFSYLEIYKPARELQNRLKDATLQRQNTRNLTKVEPLEHKDSMESYDKPDLYGSPVKRLSVAENSSPVFKRSVTLKR